MLKKFQSIAQDAKDWVSNQQRRPKGRGLKALTMCKKCYTFYYKKSWHFERPLILDQNPDQEIPVRFTECPACLEQEVSFYDGETNFAMN